VSITQGPRPGINPSKIQNEVLGILDPCSNASMGRSAVGALVGGLRVDVAPGVCNNRKRRGAAKGK
jgi:hypothetical protein